MNDSFYDKPELKKIDEEYAEFFKTLEKTVYSDVKRNIKSILTYIFKSERSIEELSEIVQNSYKVRLCSLIKICFCFPATHY